MPDVSSILLYPKSYGRMLPRATPHRLGPGLQQLVKFSTSAAAAREKLAKKPKLSLKESIAVVQAREARKQRQRHDLLEENSTSIPQFHDMLTSHKLERLARAATQVVQVNIGKLCNLTCRHCHVESGPTRTENMDERTVDRIISVLARSSPRPPLVDITGGAPELNPHWRKLVAACTELGIQVMDRCNLSVLFQPGQEDTASFLAAHCVHIIASLPSTEEMAVDRQRGQGAYSSSIQGLRLLNSVGYGRDPALKLDLIFNPPGLEARLPPPQAELQATYEQVLGGMGIAFNRILSLTNMPVKRYADDLARSGQLEPYMNMLALSFSPEVVPAVMCRTTISIDWQGRLYDCDFNQQMGMDMGKAEGGGGGGEAVAGDVWSIDSFTSPAWVGRPIVTSKVCYGCTAGEGSSCTGALK